MKTFASLVRSHNQLVLIVLCFVLMLLLTPVLITTAPDLFLIQDKTPDFFAAREILWGIALIFWTGPFVCLVSGIALIKNKEWAEQLLDIYTSILLYVACVFVGAIGIFVFWLPQFFLLVFGSFFLLCLIMKFLLWETSDTTSEESEAYKERIRKRLLRLILGMVIALLFGFFQARTEQGLEQNHSFFGHF